MEATLKTIRLLVVGAAAATLAACSTGASGNVPYTSVNPVSPSYSKLQMAVGTANVAGVATGLNVVTTLRQPNGNSAVLVDTPTLTGPFTLPAAGAAGGGVDAYSTLPAGPSASEVAAGATISGTPQTVRPGTPVCDSAAPCGSTAPNTTTFGQSGGVFGLGFAPYNSQANTGQAASYVPYHEPLYDATGDAFLPWGGPPAFDPNKDGMGTRDGTFYLGAGVVGVAEGLTTFENVTPGTGTYNLSVVIPTGFDGSGNPTTGTITAKATLNSTGTLPTVAAPAFTPDGNGGGSFTIGAMPAGVTEMYVQIVDVGPNGGGANCQGQLGTAAFPVYYTFVVKAAGTYTLPDTDGPNLNLNGGGKNPQPSPSICTAAQNSTALGAGTPGDTFSLQMIGFDYPIYEASYPNSLGNQTPVIAGANGQADITISAPATQVSP